jgi:hypothetical protein
LLIVLLLGAAFVPYLTFPQKQLLTESEEAKKDEIRSQGEAQTM